MASDGTRGAHFGDGGGGVKVQSICRGSGVSASRKEGAEIERLDARRTWRCSLHLSADAVEQMVPHLSMCGSGGSLAGWPWLRVGCKLSRGLWSHLKAPLGLEERLPRWGLTWLLVGGLGPHRLLGCPHSLAQGPAGVQGGGWEPPRASRWQCPGSGRPLLTGVVERSGPH